MTAPYFTIRDLAGKPEQELARIKANCEKATQDPTLPEKYKSSMQAIVNDIEKIQKSKNH